MTVVWAQLLLCACAISMSAGLSCKDVTCCSGEVCVEERSERNEVTARCAPPTHCGDLQCPSGFECTGDIPWLESINPEVGCRASCNGVQCPDFFQCAEQGTSTECTALGDCSLVQCPLGTSCQVEEREGKRVAMCLGSSCETVECFNGTECFEYDFYGASGNGTGSGSSLQEFVACLPTCEGRNVCPQGMVCEEIDYTLICREPSSCDEFLCPEGQECEEKTCGIERSPRNAPLEANLNTRQVGSAAAENIIFICVDEEASSGVGSGSGTVPQTTGNGALGNQAIGNEPPIPSSASSTTVIKYGTLVVSAVVTLAPLGRALFLIQ